MSLQGVMESIEGHQFAAEVNLAAGFEAFHRSIQGHSLFRELGGLMKDDPSVFRTVLVRIVELSRKPIRTQYENPFDSAMAVYLMAVDGVDSEVAAVAAQHVSKAANCWWASQVSTGIEISASLRRLGVPPALLVTGVMRTMVAGGEIGHAPDVIPTPEKRINGRGCHHTRKRRTAKRAA